MEEEKDAIVLMDEDGVEHSFEHLDTIQLDDNTYVVLLPIPDDEMAEDDSDESEIFILKLEADENGDEALALIEDDDELNKVFDEFQLRYYED